ncbi:unnamed protein product, partial [marine sediment metagenome]
TTMAETRQDFLIPFAEVLDIHPRMPPEPFGILVKYEGEEECYAFSAWGYILGQGHKVEDWKLGIGKHVVEVELIYSGKGIVKKKFLIVNQDTQANSVEIVKHQTSETM